MSPVPSSKVTAPGQGKSIKLFAVRFDYKVTSADSGGDLAALEVTIPPRTLVKPHNHAREDEYTVVLAGTVGARVGDQVVEAGAGASLVKPRGTPHAMWNAAAEPATVLEILSPAAWRTTSRSWSAPTGSSSSPRPVAGPGAPGSRPGPG
jgi:quercetin dioxygenase-like cupin family protein